MKFNYLALFNIIFISVAGRAQFVQEIEGEYFGKNITQADLDILFVNNPNLYWLNFNYKDISWPECMEERFVNGKFQLSSCEIFNGKDGPTVAKIVSPDGAPDEWLESSDDMSEEDFEDLQKGMQRTGRMITVIRRASGFAIAGIVFLILKS